MQAAAAGQLEVVVALVDGLQVDRFRRDARGANCLHYAAENGSAKVVKWLVGDGGMQIGAVDSRGRTAMHYAAKEAQSAVMDALRGVSIKIVNLKDTQGVTPLMLLVEASDEPRLLDRFVKYGAAVDAVDEQGETALMYAARVDHVQVCSRLILGHKADVGVKNAAGKTAMVLAEENGCSLTLNVLANQELGANGASGMKRKEIARLDSRLLWEAGIPKDPTSNGSKRKKVQKKAKGKLPAGIPPELAEKFEKMGRGKRPKKCGACKACLNPSMHQACLLMRYFGDTVKFERPVSQAKGKGKGKKDTAPVTPRNDEVVCITFYEAVEDGNSRAISQFLDQGYDVNQADADNEGTTPIMYASLSGRKEMLKFLLKQGADVDGKDIHGTTALMCAAQGGHHELIEFLCSPDEAEFPGLPVDPNVKNVDGDTALHFAAEAGHSKAVDVLLSLGANPGLKNHDNQTAEMIADKENHEETSRILREARLAEPKPETPGTEPETPSTEPEATPSSSGPVASNGDQITRVNVREARRQTVPLSANEKRFLRLISNGDIVAVHELIKKEDVSVETCNNQGTTALMIICMDGDRDKFDFLLRELHANPSAQDENGMTVLMHAAQEGHADLAKELVETYQVQVNSVTDDGDTALMYASQGGHVDVVKLLVNHGSNLDVEDNEGCTSLMLAAREGHVEVVRYLMRNGAKISAEWLVNLASTKD